MGLFADLFKRKESNIVEEVADDVIVAVGTGKIIDVKTVSDAMFAEEMMGKTIAYQLTDKCVCSPANGTIEVAFPTGHAFGVRMKDGTGLLIHIGVDTVNLSGKGFKTLIKIGDEVKAGQPCVEVDWKSLKQAGYDISTMVIVTEKASEDKEYNFIELQNVTRGQKVNL